MKKDSFAHVALAAFGALCCAHAVAQADIPLDVLATLPPLEQLAYAKAKAARQQQQSAWAAPLAGTDGTPPVLTKFSAGTKLDLRQAQPTFKITVKGSDDLSGLNYLYFYAAGPSGQTLYGYFYPGFPQPAFSGYSSVTSPVSRLTEPGTYNIYAVYGYDYAGNFMYLDAAALAGLGNTTFTVVNTAGYDIVKPALVSGKILTPTVSVSSHPVGTTSGNPLIGVAVDTTDAGNTALSGVRQMGGALCKSGDTSTCIYFSGATYAGGQAALSQNLVGSVPPTTPTGNYLLYYVYVADFANNYTYLYSTDFGGDTDFSTLFPTTKIKVTP